MENNSDYQRCEMEYPFSFFLLSLRRAVIVRLFYRGSILNYGLRVSRKTTVCQQRFRSGRAGGGCSSFLRTSCNFDGKGRMRKKVATNCSTSEATASQRRSNVYRRYVKKKEREINSSPLPSNNLSGIAITLVIIGFSAQEKGRIKNYRSNTRTFVRC